MVEFTDAELQIQRGGCEVISIFSTVAGQHPNSCIVQGSTVVEMYGIGTATVFENKLIYNLICAHLRWYDEIELRISIDIILKNILC